MEIYVVHGVRKYSFKGKEDKLIEGFTIYCGREFLPEYGDGHDSQKFSVSAYIASRAGFIPVVGDRISFHVRPGDGRITGYELAK